MRVAGWHGTTLVDFPSRVASILFFAGCNLRCPYCHNSGLVLPERIDPESAENFEVILERLKARQGFISGVVLTGGEPLMQPELPEAIRAIRELGLAVKLDTNGSRPGVLSPLLAAGLVDMVAMDIKGPLEQELYDRCCGVPVDLARIAESIKVIRASGIAHQFRMTVVPGLHGVAEVERWVAGLAGSALKLQNYNPRSVLAPDRVAAQGFTEEEFAALQQILDKAGE